ncbi:alanine--tRNA ligase, cytoplasmic-like [Saccoglossus kowalevskii]|uniref:Alanine--tRNA ligase n=1 Tax=Saccoglossus kowalevskii TaxID=10224 RepID=A0ABM0GP44_SACKO|nr:PREDICTED: alanine--tRNA ligase, cytoplasmic-like [Saccoglossus kowalevskii]
MSINFKQSSVLSRQLCFCLKNASIAPNVVNRCFHRTHVDCRSTTSTKSNILTSGEIRRKFIDYFKEKQSHLFVPSSSVIPREDKTLLFTNAGMNQFKSIFQGAVDPSSPIVKYRRVVNSQKCIRAGGKHNDLDDVGKDVYHHTFFEMLGNWSFGDYFKKETCEMAWDLLINVYGLSSNRLYVTYFGGNQQLGLSPDIECRNIWKNIGVAEDRILPYGMNENFWEMGTIGPCGMCSEIHYDRIGNRNATSLINKDDPSVLELWNLVFIQYNREEDGCLSKLPQHNIDTGMGLERLVSIIQGVDSNYDTDLFQPLIQEIQKCTSMPPYQGLVGDSDNENIDMAYRVLADHIRTLTIAITDGARPGNFKQSYIIKRLIRRAVRYATEKLNASPGQFASLVPIVVDTLGDAYPELLTNPQQVIDVINREEDLFLKQLKKGRKFLDKKISKLKEPRILPGDIAWKMYDGFGFPIDLTILMCNEKGVSVDMEGYEEVKEKTHQITSQGGIKNQLEYGFDTNALQQLKHQNISTTDDSYKYSYECDDDGNYEFEVITAKITSLRVGGQFVESVEPDQSCDVILHQTCFYAEQGGQLWDDGYFTKLGDEAQQIVFEVDNVQIYGGYVVHSGTTKKTLSVGEQLKLHINEERRLGLMRNHTAAHILNWSLRHLHGDGIEQRGSLVAPDRLRFDFTYEDSLTSLQVKEIQDQVNEVIEQYTPVDSQEVELDEAKQIEGLRAVFGEVYPDPVQVVSVGIPVTGLLTNPFGPGGFMSPVELCGGTHVHMTEHIGKLVIIDEGKVSSGVRRITAITGSDGWEADRKADDLLVKVSELKKQIEESIENLTPSLRVLFDEANNLLEVVGASPIPLWRSRELKEELFKLKEDIKSFDKKRKKMAVKEAISQAADMANDRLDRPFIVKEIHTGSNTKALMQIMDIFKNTTPSSAILLYGVDKDDCTITCVCYTPKHAIEQGLKANGWLQHVNSLVDGKVGGQDTMGRLQAKNVNLEYLGKLKEIAEQYAKSIL